MGLFDRFKKKEETNIDNKQNMPLTLNYSDGTEARVNFNGIVNVDGKNLQSVNVVYIDSKTNKFQSRKYLLEPITKQDENGNVIDATEEYYKYMATMDGTEDGMKRFGAVKGFFKYQETSPEKLGSDYIGNLAYNENGQYYRHYDNSFRDQHINTYNRKLENDFNKRLESQKANDEEYIKKMTEEANKKEVNIKTSHAERLSTDSEEYKMMFGDR